jgi:hypothetical protein
MSIASLTTVGGTPLPSAAGRWEITSPVGTPPLRIFRRILLLRLVTGGLADGIRIDPEATSLKGKFSSYDYDALNPGEPALKAVLSNSGDAVVVALDAPRQVSEIRLPPGKATGAEYSVELYRLDGNTPTEKPTVSASVQNNTAVFPESGGFTDARFAARLEGPSSPSLSSGDLAAVQLRSRFAGARIGISDPNEPNSATFFWPTPEDIAGTPPANLTNVEAGKAIAAALGRYLDDFFAPLQPADGNEPAPGFVEVALILESDAPCVLDLEALDVVYHPLTRSLHSDDGEALDKQVLRFPGELSVAREVLLRLPSNARIGSARLETVESFATDRPLATSDDPPNAPLTQDTGVHLSVGRWAAQAVVPPRAMPVSGVAVAVLPLARGTRVLVELQEDSDGRPSGKKLATASLTLDQPGRRDLVALLFPEVVTLFSERYWLLLGTAAGVAIWLADAGDGDLKVLDRTTDGWKTLDGLVATQQLLVRNEQTQEQQPASLSIGGNVVMGTAGQDNARTYDLALAIGSYLDSSVGTDPAATIPLTLTSALRGIVTVYPPEIEYDLP